VAERGPVRPNLGRRRGERRVPRQASPGLHGLSAPRRVERLSQDERQVELLGLPPYIRGVVGGASSEPVVEVEHHELDPQQPLETVERV
jgi:hypothetical protein